MITNRFNYEEKYEIEGQTLWVQIEYRLHTLTYLIAFMRGDDDDRLVVSYTWPLRDAPEQQDINSIATIAAGAFIMHDVAMQHKKDQEEEDG